jgi:hypothetical protein
MGDSFRCSVSARAKSVYDTQSVPPPCCVTPRSVGLSPAWSRTSSPWVEPHQTSASATCDLKPFQEARAWTCPRSLPSPPRVQPRPWRGFPGSRGEERVARGRCEAVLIADGTVVYLGAHRRKQASRLTGSLSLGMLCGARHTEALGAGAC